MEIKDVQKRERKSVQISIRTTKKKSEFLSENSISPNSVFDRAVDELMKEKK